MIREMRLVRTLGSRGPQPGGEVMMRLRIGRVVPLLKPREVIVPVWDLKMPEGWVYDVEDYAMGEEGLRRRGLDWNLFRVGGGVLEKGFKRAKAWGLLEGWVDVKYDDGDKSAKLDLRGDFSNRGADLWELTGGGRLRR